jgi:CheY-like chemotaxis protein
MQTRLRPNQYILDSVCHPHVALATSNTGFGTVTKSSTWSLRGTDGDKHEECGPWRQTRGLWLPYRRPVTDCVSVTYKIFMHRLMAAFLLHPRAKLENTMRIIAVDDEPSILELMPLLAARCGFPDVKTFSSARFALDALTAGGSVYDCILLDINMPDMNGIELCRRVRQLAAYRKTPIIMVTAMSERDYVDEAFKAGATDYATKPFDLKELGARLRVAEELVVARREGQDAKQANSVKTNETRAAHDFALAEDIVVGGSSERLVDFTSLKNYIRQRSRGGIAASQVIAIKVDRIQDIYALASTEEFVYALQEVAQAVDAVLGATGVLISYSGSGVFVVVSNSAALLSSEAVEAEIQHLIDEKNVEYNSGKPLDIEVSKGNPIQPNFSDISDASDSFDRAIARAESRFTAKSAKPSFANIRSVAP